jgi:hypothetical protein
MVYEVNFYLVRIEIQSCSVCQSRSKGECIRAKGSRELSLESRSLNICLRQAEWWKGIVLDITQSDNLIL